MDSHPGPLPGSQIPENPLDRGDKLAPPVSQGPAEAEPTPPKKGPLPEPYSSAKKLMYVMQNIFLLMSNIR